MVATLNRNTRTGSSRRAVRAELDIAELGQTGGGGCRCFTPGGDVPLITAP